MFMIECNFWRGEGWKRGRDAVLCNRGKKRRDYYPHKTAFNCALIGVCFLATCDQNSKQQEIFLCPANGFRLCECGLRFIGSYSVSIVTVMLEKLRTKIVFSGQVLQ